MTLMALWVMWEPGYASSRRNSEGHIFCNMCTVSCVCISTSPCCFQSTQIDLGEFLGCIRTYAMCSRKSDTAAARLSGICWWQLMRWVKNGEVDMIPSLFWAKLGKKKKRNNCGCKETMSGIYLWTVLNSQYAQSYLGAQRGEWSGTENREKSWVRGKGKRERQKSLQYSDSKLLWHFICTFFPHLSWQLPIMARKPLKALHWFQLIPDFNRNYDYVLQYCFQEESAMTFNHISCSLAGRHDLSELWQSSHFEVFVLHIHVKCTMSYAHASYLMCQKYPLEISEESQMRTNLFSGLQWTVWCCKWSHTSQAI